jgi:hypothetical protein
MKGLIKRKSAAALAILAMVLNALWPLLAHAAPAEFAAPICSTVGAISAHAGASGPPLQPAPAKSFAPHCPFCLGAGDHTPVLAPPSAPVIVVATQSFDPQFTATPVGASFVHPSAHPRGPPAVL